ncbi:MAG TPA: hypothetical protein VIH95_02240 [Acidimicrobiales bacterium]
MAKRIEHRWRVVVVGMVVSCTPLAAVVGGASPTAGADPTPPSGYVQFQPAMFGDAAVCPNGPEQINQ